jgi:hypothetical protein
MASSRVAPLVSLEHSYRRTASHLLEFHSIDRQLSQALAGGGEDRVGYGGDDGGGSGLAQAAW